jgi:hypothetical protein
LPRAAEISTWIAWHVDVTVAESADRQTLAVPALQRVHPAVIAPVVELSAPPRPKSRESHRAARPSAESAGLSAVQVLGLSATALGFGGLAVGTYVVAIAIRQNHQANEGCNASACSPARRRDRTDARAATSGAALAFASGGALLTSGILMHVLGRPASATDAEAQHAPVVTAWAAPRTLALGVSCNF